MILAATETPIGIEIKEQHGKKHMQLACDTRPASPHIGARTKIGSVPRRAQRPRVRRQCQWLLAWNASELDVAVGSVMMGSCAKESGILTVPVVCVSVGILMDPVLIKTLYI